MMPRSKKQGGFSLVELLVVVAIFFIITSIVLFNQNKFSSDISISNVAYQVALKIRQAQVYGILVREREVQSDFNAAYGIHFEKYSDGTVGFALFSDDDEDLMYTPLSGGVEDTYVEPEYFLGEGNRITQVCTYEHSEDDASTVRCFVPSSDLMETITTADIVFKRPDPRAIITDEASSDVSVGGRNELHITITSSLGDKTRLIKVLGSGQISVTQPQ